MTDNDIEYTKTFILLEEVNKRIKWMRNFIVITYIIMFIVILFAIGRGLF